MGCPLCWRHTVSQAGKYVVALDMLVGKGKTEKGEEAENIEVVHGDGEIQDSPP